MGVLSAMLAASIATALLLASGITRTVGLTPEHECYHDPEDVS